MSGNPYADLLKAATKSLIDTPATQAELATVPAGTPADRTFTLLLGIRMMKIDPVLASELLNTAVQTAEAKAGQTAAAKK